MYMFLDEKYDYAKRLKQAIVELQKVMQAHYLLLTYKWLPRYETVIVILYSRSGSLAHRARPWLCLVDLLETSFHLT